ncbi:hypothetical protein L9F63_003456, partial [Diploptera punctata]
DFLMMMRIQTGNKFVEKNEIKHFQFSLPKRTTLKTEGEQNSRDLLVRNSPKRKDVNPPVIAARIVKEELPLSRSLLQ